MTFDEFRSAWRRAVLASRVHSDDAAVMLGPDPGYRDIDQYLRPLRGSPHPAFDVVAKAGCVWTALHSAWSIDAGLAGYSDPKALYDPGPPWIRFELEMSARMDSTDGAMPSPDRWAEWLGEVVRRFEAMGDAGPRWRYRSPNVETILDENATPGLFRVMIRGIHDLELRHQGFDDVLHPLVVERLQALFGWVADALDAWGDALVHLVPIDATSD